MSAMVRLGETIIFVYRYTKIETVLASSREVIRKLEDLGWRVARQRGSHVHLRHPDKPALVTVPHPTRDLKPGTLRSIERQSGETLS